MAYVDLNTLQTYNPGDILTAAALQQIRLNQEFFIDPPGCSIYNSAAVSALNNTATILNANSENFDNDSMHSTSTNTSRITIQTAGRYLLSAQVGFAANATGNRQVGLYKNGVSVPGDELHDNGGGTNSTGIGYTRTLVLAAGDYVEIAATQRSGGALNVTLTEFVAFFMTR